MVDDLRVGVLGPIRVFTRGAERTVPGRVERAVLATLAIGVGHAVPVDRLMAAVWGDAPPPTGRHTAQAHVSRLRSLLGTGTIRYEDDAYTLAVDPAAIDAVRFERLTEAARLALADHPEDAARTAREALGLWRGPPYGDLGDDEYFSLEAHRLDELRLATVEVALEADLRRGATAGAVAQLESAVAEHPYREHLWHLLITGLAQADRRVEALRAAARLRAVLAETGLGPSTELLEAEKAILGVG